MRNMITMVLGGGRGTRLYPLTKFRSKPAVPLAGLYRLIDIPISNCINSGFKRIYVLTQFMSVSLHRHIRQTYRFDRFDAGFVEILAAQQTEETGTDWYQGTADAVRKNMRYLEQPGIEYVMILSGDQLYRMDYREMVKTHIERGADATIAGMPVTAEQAKAFGIMKLDETARVQGFVEKPQTSEAMDPVRMDPKWVDSLGINSHGRDLMASMGIYLFNRDVLLDLLKSNDDPDFGKQIFPSCLESHRVQMHAFDGYWEDIGTIKNFYESNLSLASMNPPFTLALPEAPVYTRARVLPPALIEGASVTNSLITDGCRIGKGAVIENSIVGLRSEIGPNVQIRNSVLMGADFFENEEQQADNERLGRPPVGIGEGTVIDGAIIDKNCRIGKNVTIINSKQLENDRPDEDDCLIRDGIAVVTKGSTLSDGWSLE
jgi:glucose-1-phosphate adenylyltransferase